MISWSSGSPSSGGRRSRSPSCGGSRQGTRAATGSSSSGTGRVMWFGSNRAVCSELREPTSSSSCRPWVGWGSRSPRCAGWSRRDSVVGQPFFVMDFVEGGVETDREDRSLAPELAVDFVRRLDELHRLDWEQELEGPSPEEATHVADRAVGRRLPLDVCGADPPARRGRRLAAPPRAGRWSGWVSSTATQARATSSTTAARCWRSRTGSSPTSVTPPRTGRSCSRCAARARCRGRSG